MSSPKTIAYLHISTNDENLEKNRADILNLANQKIWAPSTGWKETVSGKVLWKKRKIAGIIEELGAATI